MRSLLSTLLLVACLLPASAVAREVLIAFGESLEPYVMPEDASGIEVDLVRAALEQSGHSLRPVFLSQSRLPRALNNPNVDGIATITPDSGLQAHYSDVYIHYEDVAFTLKKRQIKLEKISDLGNWRIVAFPLATVYLGSELARLAHKNPLYQETANQLEQNRLLYRGVADVVIADRRIFQFMDKRVRDEFQEQVLPVQMHELFIRLPYRIAFRDKVLSKAFNQGLRQIQDKGIYQQILQRYQ